MRFGAPANFWLLWLLPLLGLFLVWALLSRRRALEQFVCREVVPRLTQDASRGRLYAKGALLLAGTGFAILALTGPQFGARQEEVRRRGVDVVVVLDVSRSMLAEDVKPSRLERAKYQITQLSESLRGDRIGLILFAGQALVQCPLTLDHGALQMLLSRVDAGAVPVPGTAIAEAIRLAARSFPEGSRQYKVLVLFTDGENHEEDPLAAARKVASEGVRVFAVGLGTPEGELIPEEGAGSQNFHKDARGNYVKTRLDEEALQQIAQVGQGGYYHSSVGGSEIEAIAEQIGHMDQRDLGTSRFVQLEERFQVPLLLALVCFAAEAWLSERRRDLAEWKGRFA